MSSVRDAFFNELYAQIKNGKDIYLVTADLGAPSLDVFRKELPSRYISSGIAEQNLIQIAVGMTWAGGKVVAYGLNPFPITRAFDQIRCLLAELKTPITLCCLNAGLCSAESGYTHMPIEDFAMLRTLCNIEVYSPSDETISRILAKQTSNACAPGIIRFDKSINGSIYSEDEIDLNKGFAVKGKSKTSKLCIISYGCYSQELYNELLNKDLLNEVKLIDLFKFPVDEDKLVEEISECEHVVSIEENVRAGGIGSFILEVL